MNHRIFPRTLAIAMALSLLCGCVSSKDYDAATSQIAEQQQTIDAQSQTIAKQTQTQSANQQTILDLQQQLDTANKTVKDYLHGAQNQIIQLRTLYENKEYEKAIQAAEELHKQFNGSPEDQEGQQLAQECQTKLDAAAAEAEEAKRQQEAEAQKSAQDKAREIIRVTRLATSSPNSAGGVDLFIGYTNQSDKTIKYVTFTVVPYNAVGDKVYSEIGRHSTYRATDTGPWEKGQGLAGNYSWYWENAWYNWSISSVKMTDISIEYTDGTSTNLSGDDVGYVIY